MSSKKSRAKNQKKKELRRKKLLDKISHANYHLKNGMHGHHGKKKCEAIKNKSIQELFGKGWHEDKPDENEIGTTVECPQCESPVKVVS